MGDETPSAANFHELSNINLDLLAAQAIERNDRWLGRRRDVRTSCPDPVRLQRRAVHSNLISAQSLETGLPFGESAQGHAMGYGLGAIGGNGVPHFPNTLGAYGSSGVPGFVFHSHDGGQRIVGHSLPSLSTPPALGPFNQAHVFGATFISESPVGCSPTGFEQMNPPFWTRVYPQNVASESGLAGFDQPFPSTNSFEAQSLWRPSVAPAPYNHLQQTANSQVLSAPCATTKSRQASSSAQFPTLAAAKRKPSGKSRNSGKRITKSTQGLRQSGAVCTWCQLAHGTCSEADGPCEPCIKRYERLAPRICVRYSYKFSEYRTIDFYGLSDRNFDLPPVLADAPVTKLRFRQPLQTSQNQVVYFHDSPTFTVRAQSIDTAPHSGWVASAKSEEVKDQLRAIVSLISKLPGGPLEKQFKLLLEQFLTLEKSEARYFIQPQSLPSREQLIDQASLGIRDRHHHFPNDVETVLDALLATYRDHSPALPYRHLVGKVLDIASLGRLLDRRSLVECDKYEEMMTKLNIADSSANPADAGSPSKSLKSTSICNLNNSTSISNTAHMQIFERVANILEPLELEALESIDQFIQGRLANPVGDPLIPALSIRRLMLHYRRIATRYRASRDALEPWRLPALQRCDLLTRHYAVAFKGTLTPFHKDWDMESHCEALGYDSELKEMLGMLKSAEKYHWAHELSHEDDHVYKKLFLEQRNKKQSTIAKEWSQDNHLENERPVPPHASRRWQRWNLINDEDQQQPWSNTSAFIEANGLAGDPGDLVGLGALRESLCSEIAGFNVKGRLKVIFTLLRSLKNQRKCQYTTPWLKLVVLASRTLVRNRIRKARTVGLDRR